MQFPSTRRLVSLLASSGLAATLFVTSNPAVASAAAPPAPYFNGFESSTDAISPFNADTQAMFDVTRVASGTGGIPSAAGAWYAQAAQNPYSGGTLNQFTRLGGYSSAFPTGGYTTSVDIYLDMSVATGTNDLRFDWSSASSDSTGAFLRDFIFNVGTDPTTAGRFVMSASNNAPGWPSNPGRNPLTVSATGWYTFQSKFYDNSGVLAVDMSVLNSSHAVLHTWTLSDPSDIMTTVGGNRYAWLVDTDFATLALDNITRSATTSGPICTPTGFMQDGIDMTAAQIGGNVTGTLDATGCNIGAYFDATHTGSVITADITGANYFGVLVRNATVDVTGSTIHKIGENPLNGTQHGNAIAYRDGAHGTISGNIVTNYQKNGITVRDSGSSATINGNTVTGQGAVTYIAQNGIQVSFGASAHLFDNNVSLNRYTPAKVTACGLLIYKAGGVSGQTKAGISYIKADNDFHNNETNICNFGKGGAGFSL